MIADERSDAAFTRRVLHGDAMSLNAVDTGILSGERPNGFFGTASDDLWLVGASSDDPDSSSGIARHFNGTQWSSVGSGLGARLNAAWGTRAQMFFVGSAAGGYIASWAGGAWGPSVYQGSTLIGAWGASGDDVWAVGAGDSVLHQKGSQWTTVDLGLSDASVILQAIWGSSATDVWAVGYRGFAGSPVRGIVLHWDGSAWSVSPASPAETLYAVWGAGPDDVWIGGTNALLHLHSGVWQRVSAADIR
jgi:hypothetical protein